jgi:galactokinase
MGSADSALLIHFQPTLSVDPTPIPPSDPPLVFVIANTLVTSDKHTTAPTNYNLRVVETRLAAAVLGRSLGMGRGEKDGVLTLRDVMDSFSPVAGNEAQVLETLLEKVQMTFKDGLYTRQEAAEALDMSVQELEKRFVGSIVIRCEGFKLKQRALHVLSEARRVYTFRDVCLLKPPFSGNLLQVSLDVLFC